MKNIYLQITITTFKMWEVLILCILHAFHSIILLFFQTLTILGLDNAEWTRSRKQCRWEGWTTWRIHSHFLFLMNRLLVLTHFWQDCYNQLLLCIDVSYISLSTFKHLTQYKKNRCAYQLQLYKHVLVDKTCQKRLCLVTVTLAVRQSGLTIFK